MKILISVLTFCIVLFLYLHIFFHVNSSNDLEVYEIEQPSKEKLEQICDLKQPLMFDYECMPLLDTINREYLYNNYAAFDIKVRNIASRNDNSDLYIPLSLGSMTSLLESDKEGKYFCENNTEFLNETVMIKTFRINDGFLRPHMVSNCNYDILLGSDGGTTPFRYNLNYRNYFLVTEDEITVKLAPPSSSKYLYTIKDYLNFEFYSPINPWEIEKASALHQHDFNKVKCLEFKVKRGQIVQIPAYWWYSIKFGNKSTICSFKYRTYMNFVSILPEIFVNILQQQNVKRQLVKKKMDINYGTGTGIGSGIGSGSGSTSKENTILDDIETIKQNLKSD